MNEKKQERGLYIVFEGGEGSGTTSMTARTVSWFDEQRRHVRAVREPGETELGQELREMLLRVRKKGRKLTPREQIWLFSADRASLFEEIITPSLCEGVNIVSDRSVLSTWAYQIHAGRLQVCADMLRSLTAHAAPEEADLCFLLRCDPEIGLRRAKGRGEGATSFEAEDIEYHRRVARGYEECARSVFGVGRVFFIDTSHYDEEETWEIVRGELERRFGI